MKVVVGTLTNASANIASMHTQKHKKCFHQTDLEKAA